MQAIPVYVSSLWHDDLGALKRANMPCDDPEAVMRALVTVPRASVSQLTDTPETVIDELVAGLPATKLRLPAWVPARFEGERRTKDACLERQIIGHDFDALAGETFEAAVEAIAAMLPGRFLAIHTTAQVRNADGTWRIRAYEILDRPATPEDWCQRVQPHMRALGQGDTNALDISRLFFLPVETPGYRFAVVDGPRTTLDSLPIGASIPATTTSSASTAPVPVPATDRSRRIAAKRASAAKLLGSVWPEKGRHGAQLALAGALKREGWGHDDALSFLCSVCREAGNEDRAKREKTIEHTWATEIVTGWSSLESHVDPAIVRSVRDLVNPHADDRAAARAELAGATARGAAPMDAEKRRAFVLVPASDLAKPLTPVRYLVRHFGITPGRPTLLAGYGGTGKTILVQCLALHIAAGKGDCWGLDVGRGAVLHVDYEMTLDPVQRRYQRLALAYGLDLASCKLSVASMPEIYLSDADAEDALVEACTDKVLCVIDNLLAACVGQDVKENDSSIRKFLDRLTRVAAKTGCCFLVLAHERKTSKDDAGGLQRVRGNSAITDACGAVVSVGTGNGDGILSLAQTKASHRKAGEELLLKIEDVGEPHGDEDAPGLKVVPVEARPIDEQTAKLEAEIVELLSKGPQPTKKAIEDRIKGRKGRVGPTVDGLVVKREVVFVKGRGYCLDYPTAREQRVVAALAEVGETWRSPAQIAKAANVDTDFVNGMIFKGQLSKDSSGRFWSNLPPPNQPSPPPPV